VRAVNYSAGPAALITTFLLAVILTVGPLLLGAARFWVATPLLGVAALLVTAQGLRLVRRASPGTTRQVDAIDLSVVVFVLYAIARWLTSSTEYFSRMEVMEVVAYAGVFLTCRYGMGNRRCCMAILYLLVLLGLVETIFGYYLSYHADWSPFGPAERVQLHYLPRWVGTYESPNHYANLLVMAIGTALALGSFSKLAWPARIVLFYVSLMIMVGVIYSGSRGSWIALTAAIGALVIVGIRNGTMRWWVPVTGAAVLIGVSGFLFSLSPVVVKRLGETQAMVSSGGLAADGPVRLATEALRTAHDHPIFGAGGGTFIAVRPGYGNSAPVLKAGLLHNDYLVCLDDYGLVGFGLVLFFIAAVTLKFFQPLIVDNRWQDRVLVAAGFAAWAALLVHSLVDFNLHVPANALWLFSLTGMGLGRVKGEKHWSTSSLAPLGPVLGWGVVLFGLIFGAEVTRTAWNDAGLAKAFTQDRARAPRAIVD
jgi:hypothetical protein